MDDSFHQAVADLAAWQRLGPLLTDYLPFPAGSLRPTAIVALLDEVLIGDRSVVVQCGSGSSSILLARLLSRRGFGRLLALEHDERAAAFVTSQLRRERLSEVARVVHTPLTAHPAALGGLAWYEPSVVFEMVTTFVDRNGLVDLLLVDGPPSADRGPSPDLSRYPALPVLRGALSPGATVLVDDADRLSEQAVLDRWSREFGLRFRHDETAGLAVAVVRI
ncbi:MULTISPECIES: class I SAM-dependent methyltransferase [Actinoalloteichus]|uniref:Methyltransferase domain n=1 Tax=Actinoalloteichus fjordicus TaxID=1612552 RepID=A0AAC9L6F2_9PSEU|nr:MULTISPECIES: class I SAM-dependent methyltransferase [Actinoalloteichus]APU12243.1 Methyltransferase domain [Actinoalloteichus fjordicus]APU18195.1 Methyltransferase domain [Actinoalloteichus sp. GBA129-24]